MEINNTWEYQQIFINWTEAQQKEFLDICTGLKDPKMTYDVFFKESVNPEYAPERLGDFLSNVLGQKVKVIKVLPNDSVRITLENSLLITDVKHKFCKKRRKNMAADKSDKKKKAVALSYDPSNAAPQVVAAGQGAVADRIIDKAKEADVATYKDEGLADTLLKLEVGDMIPPELYGVVAEVLVYVDRMDKIKSKLNR